MTYPNPKIRSAHTSSGLMCFGHFASRCGKASWDRVETRLRVVAQEPDDRWHVTDFVAFPASNREFVDPSSVGNLLLEEFEVQPTRANVVA